MADDEISGDLSTEQETDITNPLRGETGRSLAHGQSWSWHIVSRRTESGMNYLRDQE